MWAALAHGAYRGWPLLVAQLLAFIGPGLWLLRAFAVRRLEWRRTALDVPLAILVGFVVVQITVGNGPLVRWALAPVPPNFAPAVDLPVPFLSLGTVAPGQTLESLVLLLAYISVYVTITQLVTQRHQVDRLVRNLVLFGALLAFPALGDYLTGGGWLVDQREEYSRGRLAGTYVNPDHFGTWLVMLVCLGLGYLATRRRTGRKHTPVVVAFRNWRAREDLVRRYLPFAAVAVIAIALIFTLSRGAVLAFMATLVIILALLGAVGVTRWSLVLVGALVVVTAAYAAWIGLEPFLARVQHENYDIRLIQALSSLPMLAAFPVFGVGLGAYKDMYFRYQPAVLKAGDVYFPYAHNDLLQVALEVGLVGSVIVGFAAYRVARDLIVAHLLGRGRCPVGGGDDEWAQRSDPFSVGIGLGGAAAVAGLLLHSLFDFSARIPANGMLAAACLGISTVALHTRFGTEHRPLVRVVVVELTSRTRRTIALALPLVALVCLGALAFRPALAEAKIDALRHTPQNALVTAALGLDGNDLRILKVRSKLALEAAVRAWQLGVGRDGRRLASLEQRRTEASALLAVAFSDLRRAIDRAPSYPFFHERTGQAHWLSGLLDPAQAHERLPLAVAYLKRAIVLGPEHVGFYQSLVDVAIGQPKPLLPLALDAARAAVKREPESLPMLVSRFLHLNLADAEWLALVPPTTADRLHLGTLLEVRGALRDAVPIYRGAVDVASAGEEALARWMLARLLLRAGDASAAGVELRGALKREPQNPELHLVIAESLVQRHDPDALDAYRAALVHAEERLRKGRERTFPFGVDSARVRHIVAIALRGDPEFSTSRYRRALAEYLTRRNLWTEALRQWQVLLLEQPNDAAGQFSVGLALDALGRRNEALEAYRKAAALGPGNVRARLRLAQALWQTDQYYQAMLEWEAIVSQDPKNVEARLALARALTKGGDRAGAVKQYRQLLEIDRAHATALEELRRLEGMR